MPIETIITLLKDAKPLAKAAADLIPGGTPDEKAATVLGIIEPPFKAELATLGASSFTVGVAGKLLELAVAEAIKEAEAA